MVAVHKGVAAALQAHVRVLAREPDRPPDGAQGQKDSGRASNKVSYQRAMVGWMFYHWNTNYYEYILPRFHLPDNTWVFLET